MLREPVQTRHNGSQPSRAPVALSSQGRTVVLLRVGYQRKQGFSAEEHVALINEFIHRRHARRNGFLSSKSVEELHLAL